MIIKLTNPKIYTIGQGVIIGNGMEALNEDQIISLIQEALLKRSIIAEDITISKKQVHSAEEYFSAGEFL